MSKSKSTTAVATPERVSLAKRSFPVYGKKGGAAPAPTVWANGEAVESLSSARGECLVTFAASGVSFTSEGVDAERARLKVSKGGKTLGYVSLLISAPGNDKCSMMRLYQMADECGLSQEQKETHQTRVAIAGLVSGPLKVLWPGIDPSQRALFLSDLWKKLKAEKRKLPTTDESGTSPMSFIPTPSQVAEAIDTVAHFQEVDDD
jgi:hypothetical protein